MFKSVLAAGLLAAVVLGACSPAVAAPPSASPSSPPSTQGPSPSVDPAPIDPVVPADPIATPRPSETPDAPSDPTPRPTPTPESTTKPAPAKPTFTAAERYLLDGIRRDAHDCQPVRAALPATAVAGIECRSDDPAVARIGFYLFEDDATMLDHYFARLETVGVERDSGDCHDGAYEGPYVPGEEEIESRNACFVNDEGYGNYRVLLDGSHVYIGILGRNADTMALAAFAFRYNQDVPGFPTLWQEPD